MKPLRLLCALGLIAAGLGCGRANDNDPRGDTGNRTTATNTGTTTITPPLGATNMPGAGTLTPGGVTNAPGTGGTTMP